MYIALAWAPLDSADPDAIEGEILAAIESLKFVNWFTPLDGLFLANIKHYETRYQVQLLHSKLLPASTDRFTYVISVSPTSWAMAASADVPDDVIDDIADYQT